MHHEQLTVGKKADGFTSSNMRSLLLIKILAGLSLDRKISYGET